MNDAWELHDGQAPLGPLPESEVIRMIVGGMGDHVLTRRAGSLEWLPLRSHVPFALAFGQRQPVGLAALTQTGFDGLGWAIVFVPIVGAFIAMGAGSVGSVVLVVVAASAAFIWADSSKRNMPQTFTKVFGVLLVWFIVHPWHLVEREKYGAPPRTFVGIFGVLLFLLAVYIRASLGR